MKIIKVYAKDSVSRNDPQRDGLREKGAVNL